MTIALDSRPRTPTPPTGTSTRWIPIAPAALLTVGMLGFAWLQVSAEADRLPATPAAAAPALVPVATLDASSSGTTVRSGPPGSTTTMAPGPQRTSPDSSAKSSPAAPAEDAVPSLEDQELAAYATCGA